MQLNSLNVDDSFEIRELDFAHCIFQTNKHDRIYNSINKKIIEVRSKSFEGRIEINDKFKYKDTGNINVK